MTLSRVSVSTTPPGETGNFGAISWLKELDHGVSHNVARFATVSSVISKSARVSGCF